MVNGVFGEVMTKVKQVRVLRNTLIGFVFCATFLWLLRARIGSYRDACIWGVLAGLAFGMLRWWQLQRNIARRERRYERNKIFVNYLNVLEVVVAAVAYNIYLAIPCAIAFIVAVLFTMSSAHWWMILGSTGGLLATGFLAACIVCYERSYGPLYYQYKSEAWSGAEGLLYQEGVVVESLTPAGKVKVGGVWWNAVSISGETLHVDERIEVVSVERLTLYVDRVATGATGVNPDRSASC